MTVEDVPPIGDWISKAPWRSRAVTLLLDPGAREADPVQSHTLAGKRDIIQHHHGQVYVLWTWQRRTDVRHVSSPAERTAIGQRLV